MTEWGTPLDPSPYLVVIIAKEESRWTSNFTATLLLPWVAGFIRVEQQSSTPNKLESSIYWKACYEELRIFALLSDNFLIISSNILCKSRPYTLFLLSLWDFALILMTSLSKAIDSWESLKFVSLMLWADARSKHLINPASCGFWAAWIGISVKAFYLCCQCFEKNCFTVYYWKNYIIVDASAALLPLISYAGPIYEGLFYYPKTWDY